MWVEIIAIVNVNTAESVSVSSLLICYAYINIQVFKMMLTGRRVWSSIDI